MVKVKIKIRPNSGTPINIQDWITYDDPNTAYDDAVYYGSPYEYGKKPTIVVRKEKISGK